MARNPDSFLEEISVTPTAAIVAEQNRTEQNFIYTQAVIYGIWGYLQWAFHIIIFDKMVDIQ